jgi:cytochrome c-type biogenesis protein CcmE
MRRRSAPATALPAATGRGFEILEGMNPARKRKMRLVVALSAAVVLASALIYTSFSAASPALTPSQLLHEAQPGRSYILTGTVAAGSVHHVGDALDFTVRDRTGSAVVPLVYTGTVPDPFREGREVIVTVEKQSGRFVGERNTLITKCPSKFKTAPPSEKQNY